MLVGGEVSGAKQLHYCIVWWEGCEPIFYGFSAIAALLVACAVGCWVVKLVKGVLVGM